MEKIEIIKEAETLFPDEILNTSITLKGNPVSLRYFLENLFIRTIKDVPNNADLSKMAHKTAVTFINNFWNYLGISAMTKEEVLNYIERINYVHTFIDSINGYIDYIPVGNGEFLDVTNRLLDIAKNQMGEDFSIIVGNQKRSLSEYYYTLIQNRYIPPTLDDKRQICAFYINGIAPEILDSKIDGMEITVRDHILNQLPQMMGNATSIIISGREYSIDQYIEEIVKHQEIKLEQDKLEKFNRTGENPGLVDEIKLASFQDVSQATEDLTVDESMALASDILVDTPEDYYRAQLRDLEECIRLCNNEHNLENYTERLNSLVQEMEGQQLSSFITKKVASIRSKIVDKQEEIIHFEGNKENFVQSIDNNITEIYDRIQATRDERSLNALMAEIIALSGTIADKGLADTNLYDELMALKKFFNKRRELIVGFASSQKKERNSRVDIIDELLTELKKSVYDFSTNFDNYSKSNYKLEELRDILSNSKDIISPEDYEFYSNELAIIEGVLTEKVLGNKL